MDFTQIVTIILGFELPEKIDIEKPADVRIVKETFYNNGNIKRFYSDKTTYLLEKNNDNSFTIIQIEEQYDSDEEKELYELDED